jgi:hypothetical protein
VLPKRFRRVRVYGLLHANAKPLIQRLQLLLNVAPAPPTPTIPKPPVLCPQCGKAMVITAIRSKGAHTCCADQLRALQRRDSYRYHQLLQRTASDDRKTASSPVASLN